MRPADDLEGPSSDRGMHRRCLSRRHPLDVEGDEADRGPTATIGGPAEVRHRHQARGRGSSGKVSPADRLMARLAAVAQTSVWAEIHPGKGFSPRLKSGPPEPSAQLRSSYRDLQRVPCTPSFRK